MSVVVAKSYVEYRNDAYWLEGTRISLDSIVYLFQQGLSPESIVQSGASRFCKKPMSIRKRSANRLEVWG